MAVTQDEIDLFTYTTGERESFEYIDRYARSIGNCVSRCVSDNEFFVRYMLAGLFLTYRASCRGSLQLTTRPEYWKRIPQEITARRDERHFWIGADLTNAPIRHYCRLMEFRRSSMIEIGSGAEYRNLIGFGISRQMILFPAMLIGMNQRILASFLCRFVTSVTLDR